MCRNLLRKERLCIILCLLGMCNVLLKRKMGNGRDAGLGTDCPTVTAGLYPYISYTSLASKILLVGMVLHRSNMYIQT